MYYNPYGTVVTNNDYNPYKINNSTNTGYNVPTYNANNTNG